MKTFFTLKIEAAKCFACKSLGVFALGGWILCLAGCAVGPDYQRPPINAPVTFRGEKENSTKSFAHLPWWQVFHDNTLQDLIRVALTNNYDLRIAVTRVEQARAIAAQARSGFFPRLDYTALAGTGKNETNNMPSTTRMEGDVFAGDVNVSWEIDLWGRLRRLNESARAQFLASEETQRDVTISLIAQIAQNYFQVLALDRQLEIARQSANSFGESLNLFTERLQGGVASKLETSTAQALRDATAATIPGFEQQIALQENQLNVLLGQNPGAIMRGNATLETQMPPEVPAGLPSALLERRPDIRAAEQQLRSANAQVGVAVANFFPQLNLTGLFGAASTELSTFTSGANVAWGIAAGLTGPIFHAGQLRAQYARARAARDQQALQYQATVLNAFREVSNALISRDKLAVARTQQSRAVEAYQETLKISMERYLQGNASYYEVLQEQQLLFPAENALVQFQLNQLLAVVQLYRTLGGGWDLPSTTVQGTDKHSD